MTLEDMRLRALELAHSKEPSGQDAERVLDRARRYADFLSGAGDAKVIEAARAFVRQIA